MHGVLVIGDPVRLFDARVLMDSIRSLAMGTTAHVGDNVRVWLLHYHDLSLGYKQSLEVVIAHPFLFMMITILIIILVVFNDYCSCRIVTRVTC
jgi:hypothetical protein